MVAGTPNSYRLIFKQLRAGTAVFRRGTVLTSRLSTHSGHTPEKEPWNDELIKRQALKTLYGRIIS
jgi:hypothetical protein